MEIKDSGKRQEFATGAVRDTSEGKPSFGLLPVYALGRVASHFGNGRKKYPPEQRAGERLPVENWRRGMDTARTLESMLRHGFNYLEGDRSEDHLAAVVFNALVIMETEEMVRRGILPASLDSLPDWTKPNGNRTAYPDALKKASPELEERLAGFLPTPEWGRFDSKAMTTAMTPSESAWNAMIDRVSSRPSTYWSGWSYTPGCPCYRCAEVSEQLLTTVDPLAGVGTDPETQVLEQWIEAKDERRRLAELEEANQQTMASAADYEYYGIDYATGESFTPALLGDGTAYESNATVCRSAALAKYDNYIAAALSNVCEAPLRMGFVTPGEPPRVPFYRLVWRGIKDFMVAALLATADAIDGAPYREEECEQD